MARKLSRAGKLLAALASALMLTGVVMWVGAGEIWQRVLELRAVLPIVLVTGLLKHVLRAWAWSQAMRADGVRIRFRRVLRARMGAQSFAYVSGMGLLVSEPLRAWLLRRSTSIRRILAASVVESGLYLFTSVSVTTLGFAAAAYTVGKGANGPLLFGGWMAIFLLLTYLLFTTRPLLPKLARAVAPRPWLQGRFGAGLEASISKETEIRSFRLRHPGETLGVLAINFLEQFVVYAEIWVMLRALGSPFTLWHLLAIESAGRVVKMLGFYLPGRIGADEAGAAGSFAFLGLNPAAGVSLAVARRVASLFWVGFGFAWLGITRFLEGHAAGDTQVLLDPFASSNAPTNETAKETL